MKRIVVYGAGGFAREVEWLVRDINRVRPSFEFAGYIVSDTAKLGPHDSASQVLGDESWLERNAGDVDALALGIGSPGPRIRIGASLSARYPAIEWPALVHPSVMADRDSLALGRGVLLCAGVIATVSVTLEDFAMVNLACTLGHEAIIGRGSVLNPTVNVSGGVHIGEGVLIGTGAQLLQYVRIGPGAVVGAGAVVAKDVPESTTVVGIPARPLIRSG